MRTFDSGLHRLHKQAEKSTYTCMHAMRTFDSGLHRLHKQAEKSGGEWRRIALTEMGEDEMEVLKRYRGHMRDAMAHDRRRR